MHSRVSNLTKIGILIYLVYMIVNRFIIDIPDILAIPIMVIGIILILAGIIKIPRKHD